MPSCPTKVSFSLVPSCPVNVSFLPRTFLSCQCFLSPSYLPVLSRFLFSLVPFCQDFLSTSYLPALSRFNFSLLPCPVGVSFPIRDFLSCQSFLSSSCLPVLSKFPFYLVHSCPVRYFFLPRVFRSCPSFHLPYCRPAVLSGSPSCPGPLVLSESLFSLAFFCLVGVSFLLHFFLYCCSVRFSLVSYCPVNVTFLPPVFLYCYPVSFSLVSYCPNRVSASCLSILLSGSPLCPHCGNFQLGHFTKENLSNLLLLVRGSKLLLVALSLYTV